MLVASLEIALRGNLQEHAARAYSNLTTEALVFRRFAEATQRADTGLAFCSDRDLDSWRVHLEAERAL